MAIFLSEEQVHSVLTMPDAIRVVREAFVEMGHGRASSQPRERVRGGDVMLHNMAAATFKRSTTAFKVYTTTKSAARFLVGVHNEEGQLRSLIEANHLGRVRTGAATAVAADLLCRRECHTVGLFGSGFQAEAQLAALCEVREISKVTIWSRNESRRAEFADRMAKLLGIVVQPGARPADAASGHDIVVTATTSKDPLFTASQLSPGTFVVLMGSNSLRRREAGSDVIAAADRIVCDSVQQCILESGELDQPLVDGLVNKFDLEELSTLLSKGNPQPASADKMTIFKSVGIGLEDLAVGQLVTDLAEQCGIGSPLPF